MAMTAAADDMVLTRNGELYRVVPSDDGLVVNHRFTDGTVAEYLIPQTAGIAATSMQVGVDELTGALFVAWQKGDDLDASIEIAWLADEWWIGPYTIAGGDGTAAENPQMMLDRVVDVVEEDGELIEVATTFLHFVWWNYFETRDDGSAYLASIPLDENGNPQIDAFELIALSDLLPYGINCEGIDDAEGLTYPKVFVDPQSGAPHVFATDFPNCVFQILKIDYDVIEEWVGDTKRRRHIVLLGNASMIAVNPDVVLSNAKVEVGYGLDVVMYWDVEEAVAYVQLDENGVPPVQTLVYGDGLTHEQAIEVVRSLVH
jgi:hypothetical protein